MFESGPVTGVASGPACARADTPRRPELLAPAGDWECAKAAVENGADAIYFGLAKFNARLRAHNFTEAELPALMEFLHRRGVKGYVAFNTLIFADELADAERTLRAIIAAGVDAAIVQDVGICRLIRRLSPDFPIHASTQMSVTSAAGIEFARELGCSRVVLARELSIRDIERLSAERREANEAAPPAVAAGGAAADPGPAVLPLEVFVHGALCVAYSGQCLTSEALGGRSANRGECAQACRLPYELICDGQVVPLGARRYLLSPQDLAGLEVLPELLRAGVASLKIEGRLKSPEYVANITRIYRQALDQCAARRAARGPDAADTVGAAPQPAFRLPRYEMEMAFSRGLFTGWLRGLNHQRLVHARFGKKRGVYLGRVTRRQGEQVWVRLEGPLKPGDGVVFDAGQPEEKEEGGRVYEIRAGSAALLPTRNERSGKSTRPWDPKSDSSSDRAGHAPAPRVGEVALTFGGGDIDFSRVRVGDRVWKTSDPELERRLRRSFAGDQPQFRRPIELEAHGRAGAALILIARDELGHVARVDSTMPLRPAEKFPLTDERLCEHLGRLGGTAFKLGALRNLLDGEVILPVSELNRLRRRLVAELEARRARPKRWTLNERGMREVERAVNGPPATRWPETAEAELVVLARSFAQLQAAWQCGVRTIYCDFEDPRQYREAVRRFRQWQSEDAAFDGPATGSAKPSTNAHSPVPRPPSQILVAPPRIFKPGEAWILKQVRSCEADGYLVRNYDHLTCFADCRRVGDFSLNVANPLAAEHFVERHGLERVTASYDLNLAQLAALLRAAPPQWFEITLHQHMPMFHMEHCVFCAFLTRGTDYTNCGRPCEKHELKLRDRVGAEHPVKADVGCRNTVFNARAQTGAEGVPRLLALGARRFRLEFLNEPPEQVARTIGMYRQLLRGEISGARLWRELKLLNQLGVTRGPMA